MIHHKNSFFTKRIQFLTPVLQNGLILIWGDGLGGKSANTSYQTYAEANLGKVEPKRFKFIGFKLIAKRCAIVN